jgi:hypothetical protein
VGLGSALIKRWLVRLSNGFGVLQQSLVLVLVFWQLVGSGSILVESWLSSARSGFRWKISGKFLKKTWFSMAFVVFTSDFFSPR